ncbi:MAG: DUF1501 domain-containing protein, partial [Pirellulales bacterium]
MTTNRYCDGMTRRDVLRIGALGLGGLTLADVLALSARGGVRPAKARSAILIDLTGGPSHHDTFDLKPNAPAEVRGEFKPIATNVPGIEISEHLPKLARCADRYAILRGVSHNVAAHELGQKYMKTGNRPIPSLEYPSFGAVASKELAGDPELPPFVAVPNTNQTPGFLGVRYGAFSTNNAPRLGTPFSVRGISIGRGVTIADVERRQRLLSDLDHALAAAEKSSDLVAGLDQFSQQAHNMITSPRARAAFDTSKENPATAREFGESPFGQSCLLATRLVAAGVRFVTVNFGGWDTHAGNFDRLKNQLLPQLDAGLAGLFTTLAARGMLESTAICVTGEFGRTPKINARGGRDHWPQVSCALLAGGGMRMGQVSGSTHRRGEVAQEEVHLHRIADVRPVPG